MKKSVFTALALAALMAILPSCEANEDISGEEENTVVADTVTSARTVGSLGKKEQLKTVTDDELEMTDDNVFYDDINSMLLALQSGRLDAAAMPKCVADYICQRNDIYEIKRIASNDDNSGSVKVTITTQMSMGVPSDRTDLLDTLNKAINSLKSDGTIDELKKAYIENLTADSEPQTVEMPQIDGAETIRVVVTGDLPPFDYVSADGVPAGFNAALLAKISEKANVNIKLVTSNAGSKASMLTSGKADVMFWLKNEKGYKEDGTLVYECNETPEGISATEVFFEDDGAVIGLKK